jgi:hypothetical protein
LTHQWGPPKTGEVPFETGTLLELPLQPAPPKEVEN